MVWFGILPGVFLILVGRTNKTVNRTMNSTEKLAIAVPTMREGLMQWCHHLVAIHTVATRECESSPALDDVIHHVEQMHHQVKMMCGSYDKLRSLVGALEQEQGVEKPRFYEDLAASSPKECLTGSQLCGVSVFLRPRFERGP